MRVARATVNGEERYGEIEDGRFHPLDGDPFGSRRRVPGQDVALDDVRLLSPVDPGRVLITMGGFRPPDGSPPPPGAVPWLLPKLARPVSGDGGEVVVPRSLAGSIIWAEVELAIVIGRAVRSPSPDEARAAILGFTCFNDVSAPEFLFEDPRVPQLRPAPDSYRGKSPDTFASLGPWIETDITSEDVRAGLALTARVNGAVGGQGSTRNHKFEVADWVVAATALTTLEPGDVIALGTPQPVEVVPGDAVELEIEAIGVLHNTIVAGA